MCTDQPCTRAQLVGNNTLNLSQDAYKISDLQVSLSAQEEILNMLFRKPPSISQVGCVYLRLDIAVNDMLGMAVLKGGSQLANVDGCLAVREAALGLQFLV